MGCVACVEGVCRVCRVFSCDRPAQVELRSGRV
jgi:hypothetical protein